MVKGTKVHRGWIKVYRKIEDNPIWNEKPFSSGQAWIDLVILANHKPQPIRVKNGEIIIVNRGQVGVSKKGLADRWGWSRGRVSRYLQRLSSLKMIQQNIVENHTITTILEYNQYQGVATNESTNGQQTGQQTDTNNNVKNDKNVKKGLLDFSSIQNYVYAKGLNVDVDKFIKFYKNKKYAKSVNQLLHEWSDRQNGYDGVLSDAEFIEGVKNNV